MTNPYIVTATTDVPLKSAPIEPSWIHEGDPVATNAILATSADGTASTIVWHCTPGKFEWHYDTDETIYFLEGAVVIEADGFPPRRMGPGDVLYFKKGAVARWHVEQPVRKLAFFRRTVPVYLGFYIRVMTRLQKMFGGGPTGAMLGAN
ncbi:cupin domain-containing protein [Tepidamorphus sp. 3E244]|uniref:cupin domain-containing protein n=1 Tax=Tepidamorphus sp. 3E244 TaxID=3385498 RepID=UPI0038FC9AA7